MALHQLQEHLGSDLHPCLRRHFVGILWTDVSRNPRNPQLGSSAGHSDCPFSSLVDEFDVETTRLMRTQAASVVRVCLIGGHSILILRNVQHVSIAETPRFWYYRGQRENPPFAGAPANA